MQQPRARARERAGHTLTPIEFARRATTIAADGGVKIEILDEQRIAELGMGLLLGVARGSSEPPRLMVFRHDPPGAPAGPVLGLVGKGVTFDTGGVSIKPADGMERMKDDMAGGARWPARCERSHCYKAPIRVIGVVPATENMPGGRAIKPGDILKSALGKTVEVINTDAEGRLVLGDGLWYAQQMGATHLVDVATLTGAVVVALGKTTSGLFGTPPEWVEHVLRIATKAGDRVWADADLRRLSGSAKERNSRLHQYWWAGWRVDHCSIVSEGIRRRPALGAHGHCGNGVGRGRAALLAQRAERCGGPDARGTSLYQ